ncbi:hypothetical protein ACJX0J_028889, partial [Zea mays]
VRRMANIPEAQTAWHTIYLLYLIVFFFKALKKHKIVLSLKQMQNKLDEQGDFYSCQSEEESHLALEEARKAEEALLKEHLQNLYVAFIDALSKQILYMYSLTRGYIYACKTTSNGFSSQILILILSIHI